MGSNWRHQPPAIMQPLDVVERDNRGAGGKLQVEAQPGDPTTRLPLPESQQQQQQRQQHNNNNNNNNATPTCWQKMIALRRYSLFICACETLALIGLLYLLISHHSDPHYHTNTNNRHHHRPLQGNAESEAVIGAPGHQRAYRIYSNGTHQVRLLVGLIEGCSQKRHDFRHGIRCQSGQAQLCSRPAKEIEPLQLHLSHFQAQAITTSKAGDRLSARLVTLERFEEQAAGASLAYKLATKLEVRLDLGAKQEILGWGGALTDSTINNILSLTTNGTRSLLEDYFGPDGLRYNLIRLTIGGSDFSSRFYTNADKVPNDYNLRGFALRDEDLLYKIPVVNYIQRKYSNSAALQQQIKIFASMWSPPPWMKTNQHFNGGQLLGSIGPEPIELSNPPSSELFYHMLSELKIKWLEAYQKHSINISALTVMNEPIFAIQPFLNFNTMVFPRADYANYVAKYLGPKLRSNARLAHVQLIAHDDNRRYLVNYTLPMLRDARVARYLSGVSTHGYVDEAYDQMDRIYEEKLQSPRLVPSDFFVLPTELSAGHLPWMEKAMVGNWARGMFYALDVIWGLKHSAAGWVDWNMALDMEGGPGWLGGRLDAPVIVDKSRDAYHKSPMYYVLGQFSRYIPRGSRRLATRLDNAQFDHHLETVTFVRPQPDEQQWEQGQSIETIAMHQFVTVIVNNNPYPVEFLIEFRLNETEKPAFKYKCAADSVTTLLYSGQNLIDGGGGGGGLFKRQAADT